MAIYYFAYGADMDTAELDLHHDRRRRVRLRFAKSGAAVLSGYRLICDIASNYWRAGIFNITKDPLGAVHGVVYELHPGDTISIASMKEGEHAEYAISLVLVKTAGGEEIPAMVLHAKEGTKKLKLSRPYLDIVIKAARHHRLPSPWIQYLETLRLPSKTS